MPKMRLRGKELHMAEIKKERRENTLLKNGIRWKGPEVQTLKFHPSTPIHDAAERCVHIYQALPRPKTTLKALRKKLKKYSWMVNAPKAHKIYHPIFGNWMDDRTPLDLLPDEDSNIRHACLLASYGARCFNPWAAWFKFGERCKILVLLCSDKSPLPIDIVRRVAGWVPTGIFIVDYPNIHTRMTERYKWQDRMNREWIYQQTIRRPTIGVF